MVGPPEVIVVILALPVQLGLLSTCYRKRSEQPEPRRGFCGKVRETWPDHRHLLGPRSRCLTCGLAVLFLSGAGFTLALPAEACDLPVSLQGREGGLWQLPCVPVTWREGISFLSIPNLIPSKGFG